MTRMTNITPLIDPTEVAAAVRFGQARALPVTFLGRMVEPMQRVWRRHEVYRELMALDDRMLADIGLRRDRLGEAADIAARMAFPAGIARPRRQGLFRLLVSSLVQPLVMWARRRAAQDELRRLDGRLLRDIGIDRGQIGTLVETMRSDAHVRVPTPADLVEVIEVALLRPIRQWNRSRQTARALSRLDDRQLADVGISRSDIGWVAEELAARSHACANANTAPRAA